MSKRIGFTTSIPIEVIYAAGHTPVDLNNRFLTNEPVSMIHNAEIIGFPRTLCSWIKGNFSAALSSNLDEVIGVVQGDCSNSNSLLEMINEEGIPTYRFSYPTPKDYSKLNNELSLLEDHFCVSRSATMEVKRRIDEIRKKLIVLDSMTWHDRKITGKENHLWLVNASDFEGNLDSYESRLDLFLKEAQDREPLNTKLRLALLGVPPIFTNLYESVLELGGDIVFNEVQRQFAMPYLESDIIIQYLRYTYPYSTLDRIQDINEQTRIRGIEAVISYTQSFCHLQIDNLLLKRHIPLPFLTLEGDQPVELDSRTILRLESFFEVHS